MHNANIYVHIEEVVYTDNFLYYHSFTERKTDRQTDRQRQKQRERQRERQRETERETKPETEMLPNSRLIIFFLFRKMM